MSDTAPRLPVPDADDERLDELLELTEEDWTNAATGHHSLRCTGLRVDGERCGNPAMNSSTERLCRWHARESEDGIVDEGGRKRRLDRTVSDLPEELVRSLRSVLGTDAEPVISAFTDSLKSKDDKVRLTAATTITNAVARIGESAAASFDGLPTLEQIEAETNGHRLVVMLYHLALSSEWIAGASADVAWNRREAINYLRERIGPNGVSLLREAFSI